MSKFKMLTAITMWIILGLSGQACAMDPKHQEEPLLKGQIAVPDGTQIALFIGKNGEITGIFDNAGPYEQCRLCSPELAKKFGGHCDELAENRTKNYRGTEPPLCGALTRSTLNNVYIYTLLQSHKNPDCHSFKDAAGKPLAWVPRHCR